MKWKGKMKGRGGGDGRGGRIVSEDWWPLNLNCGDDSHDTVVIYNDACTRTLINAV
jgi:hypothetical protein